MTLVGDTIMSAQTGMPFTDIAMFMNAHEFVNEAKKRRRVIEQEEATMRAQWDRQFVAAQSAAIEEGQTTMVLQFASAPLQGRDPRSIGSVRYIMNKGEQLGFIVTLDEHTTPGYISLSFRPKEEGEQ